MSLRRFLCNITAVAPVLVAEFDWIEKNQAIFEVSSADPARFTKETLYIQKALMAASSSRRSSGDVVEASRRALGHLRRASGALAHLGRHCLPPTCSGRRLGSPAPAGTAQNALRIMILTRCANFRLGSTHLSGNQL